MTNYLDFDICGYLNDQNYRSNTHLNNLNWSEGFYRKDIGFKVIDE